MDRQAFEKMVVVEQESLRRFLLNLCGSQELANDIAQEAFIKAYLNMSTFRGAAKAATWLFAIARNCFYDHVKKSKAASSATQPIDGNTSHLAAPPSRTDANEELYLALNLLNAAEREIVLLFYMEDKSLKDVAAIVDMPVNTVKSHLRRAKQQLKKYLDYEKR
ncbi:MAG: RNA polymerase sigma factor [Prevotellaceae bacterium]|jgi:RNA polymerase sigma-70 factor (ECF subfamily)|nr:RNA polymerase sigma factor [Prevotellaceae bacterium]